MSTFSTVRDLLDLVAADPNVSPAFRDAVAASPPPRHCEWCGARLVPSEDKHCAECMEGACDVRAGSALTQADRDELQRDRDERNGDGPGKCVGRP